MRDMSWLENVCQASRWGDHQGGQLNTSEALSQIFPLSPLCLVSYLFSPPPPTDPASLLLHLLLLLHLTDDYSVEEEEGG